MLVSASCRGQRMECRQELAALQCSDCRCPMGTRGADGCRRSQERLTWLEISAGAVLCAAVVIAATAGPVAAQPIQPDFYVTNGPVSATAVSGNTLYIAGGFNWVGPGTGGGVPIDSSTGLPVLDFPRVTGTVYSVVPDGDGGWYIGGEFTGVGGAPRNNLAHILGDNTVSPWNPGTNNQVRAVAVSGNVVYASGFFTSAGGQARNHLAAFDATTGQTTPWDPNANDLVDALAVSGTVVYAGGVFTSIGGQPRNYLAALDASTGQATAWDPNANGWIQAMAVGGGTVYVGGSFSTIGGQARSYLAAFDLATGQLTGWDPYATGRVYALTLSGSTVYIGGDFGWVGGQVRNHVAALDATSGLATAWNPKVDGYSTSVYALAAGSTAVFVGGSYSSIGGQTRNYISAVDAVTGQVNAWNPSANGPVFALSTSGSSTYAGGVFTSLGAQPRNYLAALDMTTGRPTSWDPNPDGYVGTLALGASTLYVGGDFYNIGGQPRGYLAALDLTTGQATAWNPGTVLSLHGVEIHALAASGANVYVGGYFVYIGGQQRFNVAALDATTGQPTAWNPQASYQIFALAVGKNTVYATGSFSSIGGQPRDYLAALDSTTGLATDWNPSPDSFIGSLAVSGNRVYVGGGFTRIGGQPRHGLAALDVSTGQATPWDPNPDSYVSALAVNGSTIYAGGNFANIGGQPRNRLAALDAMTSQASEWNPSANGGVQTLAVSGSTVYVGGGFTAMGNLPQTYLAAIGDVSTPTAVPFVTVIAEPRRVRLTWFAAEGLELPATVYRRTVASDWQAVGHVTADGTGHIAYEDTQVSPGLRYGYRLGAIQGGMEVFSGETWVDVPRAPEFALAGARPNPALRDLTVAFSLPDGEAARLELLDMAGRRIVAREVGTLGAGNHVVNLGAGQELAPGVYLLRLARSNRSLTARAVVIR